MAAALRYPIYVIAHQDGVLILHSEGEDCVLLFHSRQFAERHIEENLNSAARRTLHALAVPDAKALSEGLRELPADVTCAIWDADAISSPVHCGVDELLHTLQD